MKYTLRPYQQEAVEAILDNIASPSNDLVVLPTGAGKSLVIADAAHRLDEPVLILSPSREITAQNRDKMLMYRPEEEVGVYSASFNSQQVRRFTFATIQTVYKKPELFQDFEYIFIDEAHTCTEANIASMFNQFLGAMKSKVYGFTATPYRIVRQNPRFEGKFIINKQSTEMIVNPTFMWDKIVYSKNYRYLLREGYLSPISIALEFQDRTSSLYVSRISPSNYALKDLLNRASRLKEGTIVFCKSVQQAESLARVTDDSAVVHSGIPIKDRDAILQKFKKRETKILFNYESLLTGFDAPHIDCIIILRTFSSASQYVQAIGRGTRLSPGKVECEVVDLGKNVKNFGHPEDLNVLCVKGVWLLARKTTRIDGVVSEQKMLNPKRRT